MEALIAYLRHHGYWIVFTAVLAEDFGLPLPGEAVLIAAGILAGEGYFSLAPVLLLAFAGAVIGDNIGYLIGRFAGRRVILRYGRWVRLREAHLRRIEGVFSRYGRRIIVVARFFSGLRQLNGIVAGIGSMPWRVFLVFNMLGAALWVLVWGSIAFTAGREAPVVLVRLKALEMPLAAAAVVLAAAGYAVRRLRKKRKAQRTGRGA